MCECARACCCCFWGVDIKDLAREYISGSNATGLALPWRFVGSAGQPNFLNDPNTTQIALPWVWLGSPASLQQAHFVNSPVLTRFTLVPPTANPHIKTLFLTKSALAYATCHEVLYNVSGYPSARTVTTSGDTVVGPWLPDDRPPDAVVELVHHHKSCAENVFRRSFRGGRAGVFRPDQDPEVVNNSISLTSAGPSAVVDRVSQLWETMAINGSECMAEGVVQDTEPLTALRDIWLAHLDAKFRATSRFRPVAVDAALQ